MKIDAANKLPSNRYLVTLALLCPKNGAVYGYYIFQESGINLWLTVIVLYASHSI